MTVGGDSATLVELEDEDPVLVLPRTSQVTFLVKEWQSALSLAVVKHKNIAFTSPGCASLRRRLRRLGNLILLATSCYDCVHV